MRQVIYGFYSYLVLLFFIYIGITGYADYILGRISYFMSIPLIYPFIPIGIYMITIFLSVKWQLSYIEDRRYDLLEKRMNTNLTLIGFSLAILGMLISVYKDNLNEVSDPLFSMSTSIFSFLVSYMLLHFKVRKLFDTLSEVFTHNGLWAATLGMYYLFNANNNLNQIATLFEILLLAILIFVIVDAVLKLNWASKNKGGQIERE